jgi:hypothetical protein
MARPKDEGARTARVCVFVCVLGVGAATGCGEVEEGTGQERIFCPSPFWRRRHAIAPLRVGRRE